MKKSKGFWTTGVTVGHQSTTPVKPGTPEYVPSGYRYRSESTFPTRPWVPIVTVMIPNGAFHFPLPPPTFTH